MINLKFIWLLKNIKTLINIYRFLLLNLKHPFAWAELHIYLGRWYKAMSHHWLYS